MYLYVFMYMYYTKYECMFVPSICVLFLGQKDKFFFFWWTPNIEKKTWNGQIEHTLSTWKQIRMRH